MHYHDVLKANPALRAAATHGSLPHDARIKLERLYPLEASSNRCEMWKGPVVLSSDFVGLVLGSQKTAKPVPAPLRGRRLP